MDTVVTLLILAALIGVPTFFICAAANKAQHPKRVYSPEEVTARIRKGFFVSFWGLDFMAGGMISFLLIACDVPEPIQIVMPVGSVIVGLVLFFIGRTLVGVATTYINFCNRPRTEMEEFVLEFMQGIEERARIANGRIAVSKAVPGVTDDMVTALNSRGVISSYRALGKVYTGRNFLKNHWPLLCIAAIDVIAIALTVL